MLLVPDQVLVQQCLLAVALLAVGILCAFQLKSGAYATFGALGGLAAGLVSAVEAAQGLEVRFRETQRLFDYLTRNESLDRTMGWAFAIGIVLLAFAVVSDRARS
jgi:hypothetical protein